MTDRRVSAGVERHVRTELVRFLRALRRHGVSVPANAGVGGLRALAEVGLTDRVRTRTALRTTLLSDSADFETFDRLFETFWDRLTFETSKGASGDEHRPADDRMASVEQRPAEETTAEHETVDEPGTEGGVDGPFEASLDTTVETPADDRDEATTALYSPTGSTRSVSEAFSPTAPDLDEAFHALSSALSGLRGRRYERGGVRPDPRRLLRESVSTGGTVLSIPKRKRRRSAVGTLFVVDVSRSVLDTIDRSFLIEFLRRAVSAWRTVRVFFFDEDLREVTDAIDSPSTMAATNALDAAETRWGGGTQIGTSLRRLRETAPDAVDRRTVTFVVSDGLEMGDIEALERELSWLSRRSKRLFWLNPLAAAASFEPTARGMAAALPYTDGLFAFASSEDVSELARQLLQRGPGGRIGYEFDARSRSGYRSDQHRRTPSTGTHDT